MGSCSTVSTVGIPDGPSDGGARLSSACLPTTIRTPEASPRRASFISNDVSARSADRGEPDIATGTELPSATNDVEHIDTDHVNKVSDVLKLHLKLGHASVQKMENAIKTSRGCNLREGDARKYMPPCPICWSTTFDHARHDQHSRKEYNWSDDYLPGEAWALDGNDCCVYSEWGGYRYALNFRDLVSTYKVIY